MAQRLALVPWYNQQCAAFALHQEERVMSNRIANRQVAELMKLAGVEKGRLSAGSQGNPAHHLYRLKERQDSRGVEEPAKAAAKSVSQIKTSASV